MIYLFYILLAFLYFLIIFGIVKTPLSRYSTEKILKEFYKRLGSQPLEPGVKCTFEVKGLPSDYHIKHMAAALDMAKEWDVRDFTISYPQNPQ